MNLTIRRSPLRRLTWFTRRSWRLFYRPLIAFSLALLLTVGYGLVVLGAVITGQVQNYTPTIRQATISLGSASGVGKYDRGQIELVSQDNPNARFIAANIVVLQVNQDSAIVEVREKEGLQVEIGSGAHVLLDIGSGQARREEEARLAQQTQQQQSAIASQQQQLEQVRRQRQWEQAQAESAQRELQLEQARAREADQQRQVEIAQATRQRTEQQAQQQIQQQAADLQEEQEIREAIAQQQRTQQALEEAIAAQQSEQRALEVAIAEAEQAQRDFEIAQAEEARARQELDEQIAAAPIQPAEPTVGELRNIWGQPDQASVAAGGPNADLPQDYLQAYRQARSQPSPENYYAFAQVLIDYSLPDKALLWLDEAETAFPETKTVNDAYEAVALADAGQPQRGLSLLETSPSMDPQLKEELRSYVLTSMGEWQQVIAISESTPSPVTQNNLMIAQYCQQPPAIERDTELPPMPCSALGEELAAEPSEAGVETIQAMEQDMGRRYPRDPYVLNTLGFMALQIEDYDGAYRHYKEMSRLLDRDSTLSPDLLEVKASAINYLNNYNQNYDFLVSQSQDLELLRAEYGRAMRNSAVRGVGSTIAGVAGGASPPALVIGAIRAIDGIFRSRSRRRQVREEQNTLLDQMRGTFRQDMGYVAARPSLEPNRMLQASPRSPLLSFHLGG